MKLVIFGAVAALALSVAIIALVSGTPGRASNVGNSNVETVGLSEHGLLLIGPKDPIFDRLISEDVDTQGRSEGITDKRFSVFVLNKTGRPIAACNLKWDILQPDGRIISHSRGHSSRLRTMLGSDPPLLEEDIAADGNRRFTLIDSGSASNNSGMKFGMGSKRRPDILSQLSESIKITVSLDGSLLVDGTFVGPDSGNYFAFLKGQIEASQDIYTAAGQLVNKGAEPDAIMSLIEGMGGGTQSHGMGPPAGEQGSYTMMKERCAQRLLGMRKHVGDKAVLDHIRAESSRPRIELRRL